MRDVPALLLAPALALAALVGGPRTAAAGESPDLSKIEQRLAKEPAYKSKQPLYGLYVFGPEARTRVWAVLDKSKPDAAGYDVLYFDRNADGDLTAANERIEGKSAAGSITFEVGTFTDPLTKQEHKGLTISNRDGTDGEPPTTFLKMDWCGKVVVRGGYAPTAGPYSQFARTPAEAPVLWPTAEGPFSFQFWMLQPLLVGGSTDVQVFLGHKGHGKNTFCAVPDTFLPKDVPVLATLIYNDKDGKERRAQSELRERC
jgi:hypothetical protein